MTDTLPTWLIAKVDQRLALMEQALKDEPEQAQLIMSPLTEPRPGATRVEYLRWDRSCDGCGKYCPNSDDFYTGHLIRNLRNGQPVYLTFGVCADCKW